MRQHRRACPCLPAVPNPEMGEEVKAVVQPVEGVTPDDALAGQENGLDLPVNVLLTCGRAVD